MWIADPATYLIALAPAQIVLWPALGGAGATLAVAVRDGRRRTALNECLHELRRPLQALALLAPRDGGHEGAAEGPVEMAAAALARLEREINGAAEVAGPRETFAARPLLESAARRWRMQAAMRGKILVLRWDADEAVVEGDRAALAAALDNLLANALEHGGERIELAADLGGKGICLAVVDSGSGSRRRARERDADLRGREAWRRRFWRAPFGRLGGPRRQERRASLGRVAERSRAASARLSGRARRGHGLRLVRRTAASHGGTFGLFGGEHGTSAVLELPLALSRWSEPSPSAPAIADRRPVIRSDARLPRNARSDADPQAPSAPRLGFIPISRAEIVIRREAR